MKVNQRVVLYRHGLNRADNHEYMREWSREKRVENNPELYEDCPRCNRKFAVKNGKMVSHMVDFKNRIPCMEKF